MQNWRYSMSEELLVKQAWIELVNSFSKVSKWEEQLCEIVTMRAKSKMLFCKTVKSKGEDLGRTVQQLNKVFYLDKERWNFKSSVSRLYLKVQTNTSLIHWGIRRKGSKEQSDLHDCVIIVCLNLVRYNSSLPVE